MRNIRILTILIALNCIVAAEGFSQAVFAQDYDFKRRGNNLMGGDLLTDPATNDKLLLIGGGKTASFFLIDSNWKLLKTFETAYEKNSGLENDHFKVHSFNRLGDKWTVVLENYTAFTVETVDFGASKHAVTGKLFEDKHKDNYGLTFFDGRKRYIMYLTKSNTVALSGIDEKGEVKTVPFELSTQLPMSGRRLSSKDIYQALTDMDTVMNHLVQYTTKKVHFLTKPEHFIVGIADESPQVEISYYDKVTGKKIKADVFSVADLLPPSEKNAKVNTSLLVFDNKVWVLSAYKNGGALGVFDPNTKKLLYSFKYDDKSAKTIFNYGPVMYKTIPGALTGGQVVKEKVDDISMDNFAKELFNRNSGMYIREVKPNEYILSLGSYTMVSVLNSSTLIDRGQSFDPRFFESAVAGLVFRKSDFTPVTQPTTFNDAHYKQTTDKYQKVGFKPSANEPEFRDKKAYVVKQRYGPYRQWTVYYYKDQIKVYELVTQFDLSGLIKD
jgi:hypothetical protein